MQGCTRISMIDSECVRPEEIPTDFKIIYKKTDNLNSFVYGCISQVKNSKLYYHKDDSTGLFAHSLIQSPLFGFIDDMFVSVKDFKPG